MNKTELKNFAIQSRRKLIDQVKIKALIYGIDEKNDLEIQEQFGQLMINDKPYPLFMKPAFNSLKNQLKQKGYKQLVEEVAYTWFNRIIAIRYMEVHDYLPEKVNVLSSSVGRVDPDILFEYETMDLLVKQEGIHELLHAGDTEGAFRKLFIAQCNALNRILPFLFEQIQDYTELLLPDFLLDAESVIKVLVQNDELTNSFDEIEVIGWLYQYYIAEEKDRVFAQKSKYKKEEIPFATQLFTPKWIVQYMVQNSLGRYWTEAHREDEDLISNWEYFIKHEEEDFHEKIAPYVNKELRVEDIKLLDPAMGSGHILVYAFEIFHQIYEKCGYPEREIPRLIIENNLYGLDIDDRAYQLAAFAVVMKASSYSRRFLRNIEREGIQLNLVSIQETNHILNNVIAYIAQTEEGERYNEVNAFFDQYENAKTYGSLINITERDITFLEERLAHIENNPVEDLFNVELHEIAKQVLPALIQQAKIMRNEYDVVVMNPPYMSSASMDKTLMDYLKRNYVDSKHDLFAAFMEIHHYLKKRGFYSAVNQHSWMFLPSFENIRNKLLEKQTIDTMIHLGARAFEDIGGEVVQTTAFTLRNYYSDLMEGEYFKLTECNNFSLKREVFSEQVKVKKTNFYSYKQKNYASIKTSPIIYWFSKAVINNFKIGIPLNEFANPRSGLQTNDNNRFTKFWFEVDKNLIDFSIRSVDEAKNSDKKWVPYNKGGEYRKWYGNNDYVVNWENSGKEIIDYATHLYKSYTRTVKNMEFYFKESITWSKVSSDAISFRYKPSGHIFGDAGNSIFTEENIYYLLGLCNSNVFSFMASAISPTLNYNVGQIGNLPIIDINAELKNYIEKLVKKCMEISKEDWDLQEVSWDFKKNALIELQQSTLKEAYEKYRNVLIERQSNLIRLEEEINKIFIKIYSLQTEISSTIDTQYYKLKKPIVKEEAKELLSYFIGVILGRFNLGKFERTEDIKELLFTEKHYFENDIINFLRKFLATCFSPDTVDENMQWLAEALEMKNGEDAEARLRRYFLEEFFVDHCKMYQKRPIYWLVDSGKNKGLRTLIYMHHYNTDTMATIRFEHLQEIQVKYQNEISDLENRLVNPNLSASEKKKLTAEKTSFEKKMDELREFDKRLAEIANEEIEIDLDDGVKINYEKFYRGGKGVLAKIK